MQETVNVSLDKRLISLKPSQLKVPHYLVRIGDKWDGGYVIPSGLLEQVTEIQSLGLGYNFSFEKECAKVNSLLSVTIYDFSVSLKSIFYKFISELLDLSKFNNLRAKLSQAKGTIKFVFSYLIFFNSSRHYHVKKRVVKTPQKDYDISSQQVFSKLAPNSLVKLDIEGFEYQVIPDLMPFIDNVLVAIIEFHNIRDNLDKFLKYTKLLMNTHPIIHMHINNAGIFSNGIPDIIELVFVKSKFTKNYPIEYSLPIDGIDFPNCPNRPSLKINFS